MTLRAAMLWIHVGLGALWIGAALSFVLAAAALDTQSGERHEFAVRAAPAIGRVGLVAAVIVLLTGFGNLWMLGLGPGFHFRPQFLGILEGKLVLYALMVLALWGALRAATRLTAARREGRPREITLETGRLTRYNFVMAVGGAAALALGLWLAGT